MKSVLVQIFGALFRGAMRAVLVVLVIPVMWVCEPFVRIRLGLVYTQRIGHLAANTDGFLRRWQINGRPPRTVFIFYGYDPANTFLFTMFERTLNELPGVRMRHGKWGTRILFAWRDILRDTRFWEPFQWRNGRARAMNLAQCSLRFTEEEEARGQALLEEMGIGPDDWFICFHSRDGNYYRQWRPQYSDRWAKLDYKNSSLDNYLPAAEYVTSKGGFAIRAGSAVERPLPETGNPRIIDYASRFRSEFGDVYLAAKCRFFIASNSGLCMVPLIFDRPVALANHAAHRFTFYQKRDLVIPRLARRKSDDGLAGFHEAANGGFSPVVSGDTVEYETLPFYWCESEADDILDLCRDMFDLIEGNSPPAGTRELQERYLDTFLAERSEIPYAADIGPRFLLKYQDIIFDG